MVIFFSRPKLRMKLGSIVQISLLVYFLYFLFKFEKLLKTITLLFVQSLQSLIKIYYQIWFVFIFYTRVQHILESIFTLGCRTFWKLHLHFVFLFESFWRKQMLRTEESQSRPKYFFKKCEVWSSMKP